MAEGSRGGRSDSRRSSPSPPTPPRGPAPVDSSIQVEDATGLGLRFRIALVSDTHGHLDPRIVEVVERCRVAVHAGDIGSAAVLDTLARPDRRVTAVRGNNDVPSKWEPCEHRRLQALPWEAALSLPGGRLAVTHGHQIASVERRHGWLRERYPDARVVVYGHTHRRCIDRSARPWIVNPGAAGRSRTFGGPSLVVIDVDDSRWRLRTVHFERATPRRRRAPRTGRGAAPAGRSPRGPRGR